MRVAIAMLLIATGVAGCSADVERQSASGALARAEATTRDLGSVRVRTTMRGIRYGVPMRYHGGGSIDFRDRRVWMSVTETVDGRDAAVEAINEERARYTRYGPSRTHPRGSRWSVLRSKQAGVPSRMWMTRGGRYPAEQLSMFAYIKNVGRIGTEQIGGVSTARYTGEVELPGFQLEPIDFWVDDQWRIRRLRTVTISSDNQWRATTTTDFYDYGEPVSPIAPPTGAADVTAEFYEN